MLSLGRFEGIYLYFIIYFSNNWFSIICVKNILNKESYLNTEVGGFGFKEGWFQAKFTSWF